MVNPFNCRYCAGQWRQNAKRHRETLVDVYLGSPSRPGKVRSNDVTNGWKVPRRDTLRTHMHAVPCRAAPCWGQPRGVAHVSRFSCLNLALTVSIALRIGD